MKLLDSFQRWRVRRRHLAHMRYLRKARVVLTPPDPRCVVRNLREPNR